MVTRPHLRSVGRSTGTDPPSVLFQRLCSAYPELPRRAVGEVLSRVLAAVWESSEAAVSPEHVETAAGALLDAIRIRAADAARRVGSGGPRAAQLDAGDASCSPAVSDDLRTAFDPVVADGGPSRFDRVSAALVNRARTRDVEVSANLLCEAAMAHLGVAGAAVSVPGGLLSAETIGVAGVLARPLEELQVILGEGPSRDGLAHGSTVLVEDLGASQQQSRWPLYAPAAVEQGVLSQVVLPMQVGAARFGVFVLYLDRCGGLGSAALAEARIFAGVALGWLLDEVATGGADADAGADVAVPTRLPLLDDRAEIHQATGMVSVQLGVDLGTALVRIRARAFAEGRLLSELSADVVARTRRFSPDDDDDEPRPEETA